ncbi:MAG: hypothetical protein K9J17_17815 [Flavobacteriales bacterium]|nr:hypothetical protein [Flavobacteriales bacterium]
MGRLIALLTILFFFTESMAQDIDINVLLDKKWTITDYFIGEMKVPTSEQHNHTTFRSNHEVEAFNERIVIRSKWSFDTEKNTLTLSSDSLPDISEMKIHLLTTEEFKYDILTTEGMNVTIVMRPYK